MPTCGRTTPVTPWGKTWADTPLSPSVISRTSEVPPVALMTLPASPPAAMTGWFTRTPSLVPLSILTLEYHTVGDFAITRAVTGSVDVGK